MTRSFSASVLLLLWLGASSAIAVNNDPGSPLFLSNYIGCGKAKAARRKAEVRLDGFADVKSYAGYITVNKTHNSNMFFWFVMSQSNPSKDPLIVWSNGGPGVAGMDVLFNYNGPFYVTKDQRLKRRNHTLTKNHNIVYIDTPVGVGYSFTDSELGYARTPDDIGRDTISFLEQFYQIFPEFRANDLYHAGDSYGGRIAVKMATVTRDYNNRKPNNQKFNLKGLILGSAMIDPQIQQVHGDYLYQVGVIDWNERNIIKSYDDKLINDTTMNYFKEESIKFELMLNYSGSNLYNYQLTKDPEDLAYFDTFLKNANIKRALHAGNQSFNYFSEKVATYLVRDMSLKVTEDFVYALENYRVLSYYGQLDITFPYSSTQTFYRSLNWSGANKHKTAKKEKWFYEGQLAGYIKRIDKFEDVLVRNSGHIAAYYQPARICDLTTRFTHRN